MENVRQEKEIRTFFLLSVWSKGLISLAEVIGGILAFFVPVSVVTDYVIVLANAELVENPGNFIATHLLQLAQQYSIAGGTFIAIYLLSRGLIKLGLVAALLKNQLWAYPSSLIVLGLFVIYQIYQIVVAYSLLLVLLTIFDLIVMYFIWREYDIVRRHPAT